MLVVCKTKNWDFCLCIIIIFLWGYVTIKTLSNYFQCCIIYLFVLEMQFTLWERSRDRQGDPPAKESIHKETEWLELSSAEARSLLWLSPASAGAQGFVATSEGKQGQWD